MSEEYQYPFINDDGKVLCQLCGKPYLVITPQHLKKSHNISYNEYKIRFPDAPLSCDEFANRGKFGKIKDMFIEDMIGDEVHVEEEEFFFNEPIYEEEIVETPKKPKDITNMNKDKILEYLSFYFANVQKDYLIREYTTSGKLLFEYISDFADPVLKINFEFPKTFWHNISQYDDPSRNINLKSNGWKVIEINSKAPTFEMIKKQVQKL